LEKAAARPRQKIPIEVEGCKTFEELLKKGFNEIRNIMGSAGVWNPQVDEKFVSILLALQMYGLEKFLEEGPPGLGHGQSRIVDLRGAYYVDAHFDGADCERAVFRLTNSPGANFEGARLKSVDIRDMNVSSDTIFGKPVEQIDAEKAKDRADMWHFAVEANLRI
jgi:hypothetical protein